MRDLSCVSHSDPSFTWKESRLNQIEYSLMTIFADGGFMMYALLLSSMVAFGVTIAKAITLWMMHRDTDKVLAKVKEFTDAGKIDDAIQRCIETPGPTAAILLVGLRRIRQGIAEGAIDEEEVGRAVDTTGTVELGFIERGLVILATVANVAPLLGFLGTVIGMIIAFASIEASGTVDPTMVAGGIKVALITTAAGLVIAIPTNIAYNFFVTRIDKLIIDMEQGAQAVLNYAWSLDRKGA